MLQSRVKVGCAPSRGCCTCVRDISALHVAAQHLHLALHNCMQHSPVLTGRLYVAQRAVFRICLDPELGLSDALFHAALSCVGWCGSCSIYGCALCDPVAFSAPTAIRRQPPAAQQQHQHSRHQGPISSGWHQACCHNQRRCSSGSVATAAGPAQQQRLNSSVSTWDRLGDVPCSRPAPTPQPQLHAQWPDQVSPGRRITAVFVHCGDTCQRGFCCCLQTWRACLMLVALCWQDARLPSAVHHHKPMDWLQHRYPCLPNELWVRCR